MKKTNFVVGIDISKDSFHVCIKHKTEDGLIKIKGTKSFSNDEKGFDEFKEWVLKRENNLSNVYFVMEATGTYYENLAYFLYENACSVSVVLANKIKHYAKSLNVKTKTDKVDAELIASLGMERIFAQWQPMSQDYKLLRDLCRERLSLKREISRAKCQLHAMSYSHYKTTSVLAIKEKQIEFYESTISEIDSEIKNTIKSDRDLNERIEKIVKVKGLGVITIITILCETNGFELFNNIRQVVSYSGLDVQMKESGNFKGKTKISKKGNSRIRQCLYMPALSATKHNNSIKDLYERINERNPQVKMKGVVAGMRKLLILIFVLWKKNEEYNPNYQW